MFKLAAGAIAAAITLAAATTPAAATELVFQVTTGGETFRLTWTISGTTYQDEPRESSSEVYYTSGATATLLSKTPFTDDLLAYTGNLPIRTYSYATMRQPYLDASHQTLSSATYHDLYLGGNADATSYDDDLGDRGSLYGIGMFGQVRSDQTLSSPTPSETARLFLGQTFTFQEELRNYDDSRRSASYGGSARLISVDGVSADVPEPASWAMMVMGFGVIGAALRGHRRTTVSFGGREAASSARRDRSAA